MAAHSETNWLTEPEQRAWRAYLRGGRMLIEALDRGLAAHGLSLSEYEIISMLSEEDTRQMRMSELADLVVQSRSRLTHTATRLEKRGWVVREPCQGDRRGVLLTLTPTGAAKVEQIAPVHLDQVRAHLVDRLSAEQFATLGGAMENVMSGLDGFADGDGRAPNDRY
ncbi:MAG TPA: MarR family transcriptional regulator [Dermatophilaceae bacterium]|jgi:DNA-binding MarR family transcriptional regulator|nr:MarR family transcriptional regulator [Dermatophilaceae bacterium]HOV02217.1 MarR family transcriptional regulator [Dermatophilaceae bacterium]HQG12098.1 MarR family transcriptional regulator [Dermatophilaceae bacterium]HRC66101.1 MarR family transcriptional regulator [Dermatophilaceae bacterium]